MNSQDLCEIHKNNIALSRCSKCSRGICSTCAADGSSFCPKCRGVDILKVEKKHSQIEIRNILITGFIMALVFILINTFAYRIDGVSKKDWFPYCALFFAFGISIASAIYFVRKTDVFDDLNDLPFLRTKILKYIVIVASITGLPIIYFFYLVYKFFRKKD